MGAFFGAVSHRDVALDVFFGVDYHSHLGTRRAGMVSCREGGGFNRQIHSIENTPFRTKFEHDLPDLSGTCAMGCISDNDPQPLLVRSHLGVYAISTVGAGARGALRGGRPPVRRHGVGRGQRQRARGCAH